MHDTDYLTDAGVDLTGTVYTVHREKLNDFTMPVVKFINADGEVQLQDYWQGKAAKLVGFQIDPEQPKIDLPFHKFVADPYRAVGMFAVYADSDGGLAVEQASPVGAITVMVDGVPTPTPAQLAAATSAVAEPVTETAP